MSGIVKPLAWETDQVGGGLKAGEYRVRAGLWTHGYYWTKGDNEARTGFEDEEAAQSAATADFEQYVLSCLDPSYASSQAEIERLRAALRNIAEGNLGDDPWQANYAKIKAVATEALAVAAPTSPPEAFAAWIIQGPKLAAAAGCHVGIKVTEAKAALSGSKE